MKGMVGRLTLIISVLLISAVLLMAQECAIPVDKAIGPGHTAVRFDGRVYRVHSNVSLQLTFTKVDERFVSLTVRRLKVDSPAPFCELSIQWDPFPAIPLDLGTSGQNNFNLDTETGYAEKVG